MKVVVKRTGVGISIPLPGRLAEFLGLRPGTTVRVEGPDDEGAIRIVPVVAGAGPGEVPDSLSAADVVRSLSRSGSVGESEAEPTGITREIERLVERHGDAFREVDS